MSIPETIRLKRPNQFGAMESRLRGGCCYVYRISSKWDTLINRLHKVTGKSIGKITEADGFIPNANGFCLMQKMRLVPETAPVVRNFCVYEILQ